MRFELTIVCNNAAFEGDPLTEVSRILRQQADDTKRWAGDGSTEWDSTLRDYNGNMVGKARLIKEKGDV